MYYKFHFNFRNRHHLDHGTEEVQGTTALGGVLKREKAQRDDQPVKIS